MTFSLLRYHDIHRIATITLARGEKANALSAELVDEFARALEAAVAGGARVVVIRGEGAHFCAGFDLSNLDHETDESLIERLKRAETMLQALYYAPVATIALIHGGAYGAGFDLAMACDYRLASPQSRFRMPSWKMGIAIGTHRLISRVGPETAFQCLRSAAVLSANEAHVGKFVTELADEVTWDQRVEEIAHEVQALSADAYAQLKQLTHADTRAADLKALIDSLTHAPLKPRMERYVNALAKREKSALPTIAAG